MPPYRPARDIRPLTEFRAQAAAFIEHVRSTRQPLILTQHGRAAAVLIDIDVYEQFMHELEFVRDVRTSEAELVTHVGATHDSVAVRLKARLGR